jgi:hypothetical protein
MAESAREIIHGDDYGEVVVRANGATVRTHADGLFDAVPANDIARSATTLQIGDVERDSDHQGEIYGGIYPPDHKPISFSPLAPKMMDHYAAAAWAKEQGDALPTRAAGRLSGHR